jgi:hypothetical protein
VTPELLVGEEGLGAVRAHQPVRQLVVVQELHVLLRGKNGGNFKQFLIKTTFTVLIKAVWIWMFLASWIH